MKIYLLQVVRVIRKLEHSKKRLRTLVEKLETVCHDTDATLLEGVPKPNLGPPINFANLRSLSLEQVQMKLLDTDIWNVRRGSLGVVNQTCDPVLAQGHRFISHC